MERNSRFFEFLKHRAESDDDFDEMLELYARLKPVREEPCRGGSVSGRKYIHRDHASGDYRIMQDYFVERPVFSEQMFRWRFRMRYRSNNIAFRLPDIFKFYDTEKLSLRQSLWSCNKKPRLSTTA